MLERDAGSVAVGQYNANLLAVEDALYGENDAHYTGNRNTEFEYNGDSLVLSRMQALKLAILKFRESIDNTLGQEKLGLVTYAENVDRPSDVSQATPNSSIDIVAGLTSEEFDAIIDDQVTDDSAQERTAAALESPTTNGDYPDFDFNYLRMRYKAWTNIADGITAGTETLFADGRRSFAVPILIVLTDGRHTQDSTPEEAAAAAMALHPNMLIYTITFGAGARQEPMIAVANTGNGRHVHANDVDDLVAVFEQLAVSAGVSMVE